MIAPRMKIEFPERFKEHHMQRIREMKVVIGKPPSRLSCRIFSDYMNRKYGYVGWPLTYTRSERALEKLEDFAQWILDHTVNIIVDKDKQKVNISIDPWDTWSMDDTLAPIILPMLKQLKETKHGSPCVDHEDVPKDLRPSEAEIEYYKEIGETDMHFHARWDWVMNEMIYAFEYKLSEEDLYMRFKIPEEIDKLQVEQERISNGFRLFGKYYEALWD